MTFFVGMLIGAVVWVVGTIIIALYRKHKLANIKKGEKV